MQRPRNAEDDFKVELMESAISPSRRKSLSSPKKYAAFDKSSRFVSNARRVWFILLFGLATMVCVLLAVEMQLASPPLQSSTCSPRVLSANSTEYHSNHRFNTMIKTIKPFPAPSFGAQHRTLCNDSDRGERDYQYCLPISGLKDSTFCSGADRMDLLVPQTASTRCYASVLHLLLIDVYEEMQAEGYSPILTFGSLLGAVRNGSMIPFTEDTDLAYTGSIARGDALDEALWKKGYHLFFHEIWRVCVAPTHPLAGNLYDPTRPIVEDYIVPYVDLYSMYKLEDGKAYFMQELGGRTLPSYRVEPFPQVVINGLPYNTVHDPEYFLLEEYGPDFNKPSPRTASPVDS